MQMLVKRLCNLLGVAALCAMTAAAGLIPVGLLQFDVTFPGNAGQFDLVNQSGPNSGLDFPITTTLGLSSLTLVVDFTDGSVRTFGPASGYFSADADGESFDGTSIPIGGSNPHPIDATLTGVFAPLTISLNTGGGAMTILPGFSAFVSDTPLVDGDLAVIYASTAPTGTTPEPGTWMLLAVGMGVLLFARGRTILKRLLQYVSSAIPYCVLLPVVCLLAGQAAFGQVKLSTSTSPSSGVAGVTNVNIIGSLFPAGVITPANIVVTIASSCGGSAVASANASSVKTVLGSTKRVNFPIPTGLATGNYFVTIADSGAGDATFTSQSGSCSQVSVTGSAPILNSCVAGSSMGVLLPPAGAAGTVTAYVPNGSWGGGGPGVIAKTIEGAITPPLAITTPNVVNSCSSNPATGQTVCVANNKDVYLITGATLNTTLTSGSTTQTSFSGGSCNNCGVAINASNNTAVINMGTTGGSGSGVQVLDLNSNKFSAPFTMLQHVSENISVDPTRSLILSANEAGVYVLDQIQPNGSLLEFASVFRSGTESDSSAEDCSTGIALAPQEFNSVVQLVNLNAITFVAGTYNAPNAKVTLSLPGYGSFAAGLTGSAVAQGSGHLAAVTGEFGGRTFAVLQLPASPGAGVPALADYAVSAIPNNAAESAACGAAFTAGFDPHTMTAYTSPNNSHSYGVFAGYIGRAPVCLAVVDMTVVIDPVQSPRGGGGYGPNEVSPANLPASAVSFFKL